MVWFIVGLVIGLGGGWYLKGRFGAKVSAVKDEVQHISV